MSGAEGFLWHVWVLGVLDRELWVSATEHVNTLHWDFPGNHNLYHVTICSRNMLRRTAFVHFYNAAYRYKWCIAEQLKKKLQRIQAETEYQRLFSSNWRKPERSQRGCQRTKRNMRLLLEMSWRSFSCWIKKWFWGSRQGNYLLEAIKNVKALQKSDQCRGRSSARRRTSCWNRLCSWFQRQMEGRAAHGEPSRPLINGWMLSLQQMYHGTINMTWNNVARWVKWVRKNSGFVKPVICL